jgi:ech hydrogenase subunit E
MSRTVLPFGPQHPVLPEPIQVKLTLDDERVVSAIPTGGYIHRGIEQAAVTREYQQAIYMVERVCGICSFVHSHGYCLSLESLLNVEVPKRGEYLRVFWGELSRIHSHLLYVGLFADAIGYESVFMQAWRVREAIVDLMEKTSGGRVIISVNAPGGVRRDLSPELIDEVLATLPRVRARMDEISSVLTGDSSYLRRSRGIGAISAKDALDTGAVGPVMRSTGIAEDVRQTGYCAYGDLKFEPITETAGDCWARTWVRMREAYQSIDLIQQCLTRLPEGDISVRVRGEPTGETTARLEAPRGELFYYVKGNGTRKLERLRVRTPSFANIPALLAMLRDVELADVPAVIISIDPCISCTER